MALMAIQYRHAADDFLVHSWWKCRQPVSALAEYLSSPSILNFALLGETLILVRCRTFVPDYVFAHDPLLSGYILLTCASH